MQYRAVWDAPLEALRAAKTTLDHRTQVVREREDRPLTVRINEQTADLRESLIRRLYEADDAGVPVKYIAEAVGLSANRTYEVLKERNGTP